MKLEHDDDPLVSTTFETKPRGRRFRIEMTIAQPENFYGSACNVRIGWDLDAEQAKALMLELKEFLPPN